MKIIRACYLILEKYIILLPDLILLLWCNKFISSWR